MPKQKSADTQHLAAMAADTSPARTPSRSDLGRRSPSTSGATAAQLAAHAGAGRSTATKRPGQVGPRQMGHLDLVVPSTMPLLLAACRP